MSAYPMYMKLNVPEVKNKLIVKIDKFSGGRLSVQSDRFEKKFNQELKDTFGARWNPENTFWTIPDEPHTWFQLQYLAGLPVYKNYDAALIDYSEYMNPKAMKHQREMTNHILTRKHSIVCGEMGVGKTLSAMMAIDIANKLWGSDSWLWVGPVSGITAAKMEFDKWGLSVKPHMSTYHSLHKIYSLILDDKLSLDGVIFDESSLIKTPTANRSKIAFDIAQTIRDEKPNGIIALLTGTPAPKSPLDWYNQCRVACPGFLREPTQAKLKYKIADVELVENGVHGKYPVTKGWKDDVRKCKVCQEFLNHDIHQNKLLVSHHKFEASINEVARLGKRMSGLVITELKKDCVDLPEKRYQVIKCPSDAEFLRIAKMVAAKQKSGVKCLEKLRQLSDGFQYEDVEDGTQTCTHCHGTGVSQQPLYVGPEQTEDFLESLGVYERAPQCRDMDPEMVVIDPVDFPELYGFGDGPCPNCNGTKLEKKYKRSGERIDTPKDDALTDLLDQHDEIGRMVTYAGYTDSVDRCCEVSKEHGWDWIKMDGHGWKSSLGVSDPFVLLKLFQDKSRRIEKLNFIGNAKAAGMALTLTESPSIVYYSNSFDGGARTQSEDRIHRLGMDRNRGATIYDLINLPTDMFVLKCLKDKRKLELITMDEINACLT